MRAQSSSRQIERGYVLIYVLAVMTLLGGLALSVAHRQRIGVQLVHNIADMTQEEWALNAALVYTKAQLDLAQQLSAANNAKDPYAEMVDIWRIGDTRSVAVGDAQVSVLLRPGVAAPDFNLFTDQEITRLFIAIGAKPDAAADYTRAVLAAKPTDGFASVDDLVSIPGIPASLLGKPGALDSEVSSAPQDLYHLVQMGSHIKQIDLNTTPLPVIAALADLTMDQLSPLIGMRAAGPVQKDEAVAKIGGALANLASSMNAIVADLSVDNGNAWGEVLLLGGKSGMTNDPMVVRYGRPNGLEVATMTRQDGYRP